MFSGIIETTSVVTSWQSGQQLARIKIDRPKNFDDLTIGDSIAINGICLTVESFNDAWIEFAIGLETLQVTGWDSDSLVNKPVNLERSLCLGDRIHGHLVTGHVDAMAEIVGITQQGESWVYDISVPETYWPYIWKKGSVTLNGVSLTVNSFVNGLLSVCLIPETIHRTNLKNLRPHHLVTLEVDNLARGMIHQFELVSQRQQKEDL